MNRTIEEILDDCLIALEKGEDIDICLARYPEHVDELKPLLKTALKLQSLPEPEPNQQHLNELLIQIGSSKKIGKEKLPLRISGWIPSIPPKLVRASMMLLMLIVVGTTTVAFSSNSTPGTTLYPIKLFTEKVQFMLAKNSRGKAELRITFSEKRIEEFIATYNRDKSLDRELLGTALNEAKLALDRISELPDTQPTLLAKLDHLNSYQKDVLEQIEVSTPADSNVIQEAIDLCRDRGRWMQRYRTNSTSENKREIQQNQNSPWREQCRW